MTRRAMGRRQATAPPAAGEWRRLFRVAEPAGWYTAGEPRALARALEHGLPKDVLADVVRAATDEPALQREVRERIVPRSTWNRRARRLSRAESERTVLLARVVALAEWVWKSRADAQRFLAAPHAALGGRRPLDLVGTLPGALAVERELLALEYGLPA